MTSSWVVKAEPREAEVLRHAAGEVIVAVVEERWRERNRLHALLVDHVDRHGAVIKEPRVEELHLELRRSVRPERAVGAEADVTPLVVTDVE
jgi:hypothetical protein